LLGGTEKMKKWKMNERVPKLTKKELREFDRKTERMLNKFGFEVIKKRGEFEIP